MNSQLLRDLADSDGLLYEMEHYGEWTISSMLDWNCNNERGWNVSTYEY